MTPEYRAMLWYSSKLRWQVFPCRFKEPLTEHGLLEATTDPRLIAAWERRWPDAGVAIRTGADSGIFVMDVDPRHGGADSLSDLIREYGHLPPTIEALTGGGGRHFVFKHPGNRVKNSQGFIRPGVDIRGDGGYIIAAPTVHESGRKYEWEVSSRPDTVKAAPAPSWLLKLIWAEPERTGGAAVLPAVIREGERDGMLTSLAGSMRRRGASESVIMAALTEANATQCDPPLPTDQVHKIAASVARYNPARMEHNGINLWDTIVGDRFKGPPPPGDENWDEFAADLEVGAMLYRLGERIPMHDFPAITEAYRLRSYVALTAAIAEIEMEATVG